MESARLRAGDSGLLMARLNGGGAWGALTALREGMREHRRAGRSPRLASFEVIARDGKVVDARDRDAAVYTLEYRLEPIA